MYVKNPNKTPQEPKDHHKSVPEPPQVTPKSSKKHQNEIEVFARRFFDFFRDVLDGLRVFDAPTRKNKKKHPRSSRSLEAPRRHHRPQVRYSYHFLITSNVSLDVLRTFLGTSHAECPVLEAKQDPTTKQHPGAV